MSTTPPRRRLLATAACLAALSPLAACSGDSDTSAPPGNPAGSATDAAGADLTAPAVPAPEKPTSNARLKSLSRDLADALAAYKQDNGTYPVGSKNGLLTRDDVAALGINLRSDEILAMYVVAPKDESVNFCLGATSSPTFICYDSLTGQTKQQG